MKNLLLVMGAALVLCSGCVFKAAPWPPTATIDKFDGYSYLHVYWQEQTDGLGKHDARTIVSTPQGRYTLLGTNGEPLLLSSELEILDFFAKKGWKYVREVKIVHGDNQPNSYGYLIEKDK